MTVRRPTSGVPFTLVARLLQVEMAHLQFRAVATGNHYAGNVTDAPELVFVVCHRLRQHLI
jgi:hypothetical protein